ncbi:MAG: hypothetical protein QOF06_637 [Solirubrobacterales bacterium]|jgi:hypothetical protein|nr:hypothetical protein [Solirubrobacterales bacterium]
MGLTVALVIAAFALPPPLPAPSEFAPRVDNPWFPLHRGTTYVYRGHKDGAPTREQVAVFNETKTILGVRATVVGDKLYARRGGRWSIAERTRDWYAQDRRGNVWYLGEATAEIGPGGAVVSREGSWQAGVDGARAGIFMPAHPRRGQSAIQEMYAGEAEDHFKVLSLSASVRTPAARSDHALLTREWTPLEPGVVDHKLYVRGIGTAREQTVKGGDELNELVAVRR